jgi:hypothetical protein
MDFVTYTQTWYAEDACGNVSAQVTQTISVPVCHDQFCTLTQGFYGNKYGVACHTGELTLIMIQRLTSAPFGNLVVGAPGRSLTVDAAHSACITKRLPAGGTPAMIPEGDHVFGNDCANEIPVNGGDKFDNVLLGQTIALTLNLRVDDELGDLILEGEWMTTAASDPGEDDICGTDDDIELPGRITKHIPMAVLTTLDDLYGSRSVNNLLALANRALGGLSTGSATLIQINEAVSSINEGFDGCRFLVGFSDGMGPRHTMIVPRIQEETTTIEDITIKAYPNPFAEEVTIEFTSSTDGEATVEIFDLAGNKIASIYNGEVKAGMVNTVKFRGEDLPSGIYLYVITSGDKRVYDRIILTK